MRIKRDYMGNDQLLPSYNVQAAVCDEYIATIDVKQYASDMDCFIPLMEKFKKMYGFYPKYPTADAGYGSYNNYIYCEMNNIEKFMKFTMFEKESKMHQEVLQNLNSIHGALLRMNRSIQAEGTFGSMKSNRSYKRIKRKGLENVILEIALIACGFNLYKYDNKMKRLKEVA